MPSVHALRPGYIVAALRGAEKPIARHSRARRLDPGRRPQRRQAPCRWGRAPRGHRARTRIEAAFADRTVRASAATRSRPPGPEPCGGSANDAAGRAHRHRRRAPTAHPEMPRAGGRALPACPSDRRRPATTAPSPARSTAFPGESRRARGAPRRARRARPAEQSDRPPSVRPACQQFPARARAYRGPNAGRTGRETASPVATATADAPNRPEARRRRHRPDPAPSHSPPQHSARPTLLSDRQSRPLRVSLHVKGTRSSTLEMRTHFPTW